MSTPVSRWRRGKVGVGRWSFTLMTWIGSYVNGSQWWMPANQVNWKLASADMTVNTDGSSYVSFRSSTPKATSSGGLEAIPTSKIEKERRRNSLRRSVSFAGLRMRYPKPLSSRTRAAICSLREERQGALARGLQFEIEQRARRKDGPFRWFLIRYNPFR